MSAATKLLLSSGEFFKLHYDTIPVKSASANVYFYTYNSKMPNFETLLSQMREMSTVQILEARNTINFGFGP